MGFLHEDKQLYRLDVFALHGYHKIAFFLVYFGKRLEMNLPFISQRFRAIKNRHCYFCAVKRFRKTFVNNKDVPVRCKQTDVTPDVSFRVKRLFGTP